MRASNRRLLPRLRWLCRTRPSARHIYSIAVMAWCLVFLACTHGNRCDSRHPCSDTDVCVDGYCAISVCEPEAEQTAEGCMYDLNECLLKSPIPGSTERVCSYSCSPVENDPRSTCPLGWICTDQRYCSDLGDQMITCGTSVDCETVTAVVE